MGRWGVGWAVVLVVGFIVTPPLVDAFAAFAVESEERYAVVGYVMGAATLHLIFLGWWLDHISARLGGWAVLGLHVGAVFVLFALAEASPTRPPEALLVPGWLQFVVPITLVALWQLVTMRWKDAFPPAASPAALY